jgi:hypothetical protein
MARTTKGDVSDTLALLLLAAGFAAVGTAVGAAVGIPVRREWLPTLLGLAPAMGIAVCGLGATAGAMVGLDVGLATTAGVVLVAVALAWSASERGRSSMGALRAPRTSFPALTVELAFASLYAALAYGVVRLAAATPLDTWDGWAIWAPKAHALYAQGDVWGPVFREPEYVMQHQEYPVLLPSVDALTAEAIGRFDAGLADIGHAMILLSFGVAAWAILRLLVAPPLAAAAGFALTGSASLIANVDADYADTAVASFTAIGVLALLVWLARGASAILVVSGVFLAAASLTKGEGLLFALAAIAAAAVLARGFGRPRATIGRFAAAVLALPAAWAVVDRLNGPGAKNVDAAILLHPGRFVAATDRIPTAASRLVEEMGEGWSLDLGLIGLGLLAACWTRQWWPALFVGVWALLGLAALVTVYFLSTAPIDWHLTTSADRVIFSIVLAAATTSPVLVGLAWERIAEGRDRAPGH